MSKLYIRLPVLLLVVSLLHFAAQNEGLHPHAGEAYSLLFASPVDSIMLHAHAYAHPDLSKDACLIDNDRFIVVSSSLLTLDVCPVYVRFFISVLPTETRFANNDFTCTAVTPMHKLFPTPLHVQGP